MGVQGKDFRPELLGEGVKPSKGLRQANLSPRTKALLEEVALSEQVCPAMKQAAACCDVMCSMSVDGVWSMLR